MSSYQYRKSHCGDKTVVRSSYLHNGISYTGKMSSLYWIRALELCVSCTNSSICSGAEYAFMWRRSVFVLGVIIKGLVLTVCVFCWCFTLTVFARQFKSIADILNDTNSIVICEICNAGKYVITATRLPVSTTTHVSTVTIIFFHVSTTTRYNSAIFHFVSHNVTQK